MLEQASPSGTGSHGDSLLLVLDGEGDGHRLVQCGVRLEQRPLAQALDLQLLGDLEEGLKTVLGDVDLAEVDEVHQGREIVGADVGEEKYGMLGGVDGTEELGEVAATGTEDDAVGLDCCPLACQRNV